MIPIFSETLSTALTWFSSKSSLVPDDKVVEWTMRSIKDLLVEKTDVSATTVNRGFTAAISYEKLGSCSSVRQFVMWFSLDVVYGMKFYFLIRCSTKSWPIPDTLVSRITWKWFRPFLPCKAHNWGWGHLKLLVRRLCFCDDTGVSWSAIAAGKAWGIKDTWYKVINTFEVLKIVLIKALWFQSFTIATTSH